ncbi:hypothetical protein X975_13841, partial [Stegodyphus mimosarum]
MAPVMPRVIRKPLLSVQCDWDEALSEKDGTVWVSCKEFGKDGKHGKLIVVDNAGDGAFALQASEG